MKLIFTIMRNLKTLEKQPSNKDKRSKSECLLTQKLHLSLQIGNLLLVFKHSESGLLAA